MIMLVTGNDVHESAMIVNKMALNKSIHKAKLCPRVKENGMT